MAGALLVDKLGRRTLFIISNIGMLIGTYTSSLAYRSVHLLTHSCRQTSAYGRSPPLFSEIWTTQRQRKVSRTAVQIIRNAQSTYRLATIPFIFIFYFFYDIAYTPMLIAYTLEILPFSIRAKGFAVMVCASHCVRVGQD